MTSTAVALAGVASTLVTALAGIFAAYLAERKRAADADRHRNHEQRAKAAMEYLLAVDAYRRDVDHENWPDAIQSGRRLEDVLGRAELFFDDDVVQQARRAQQKIVEARDAPERRASLIEQAKHERDLAKKAMRFRLEGGREMTDR